MTAAEARTKASEMLRTRTMQDLLDLWEMTSTATMDANVYRVRGWLLDEFERRKPEAFNRWISSLDPADELLRVCML